MKPQASEDAGGKKLAASKARPGKGAGRGNFPDNTGKPDRRNPPEHKRFKPGQSGNPEGRPKGSRNRFAEKYIATFERAWDHEGPIEDIAKTKSTFGLRTLLRLGLTEPSKFVAEAGKIIPSEFDLGDKTTDKIGWKGLWEMLGHGKVPKVEGGDDGRD